MSNVVPLGMALLCGGIFIVAVGAVGVFLVVYALRSRQKAAASQTWPSVQGYIIQSEVRQTTSTDDNGRVRVAYYPAIAYDYEVAGQTYTGKQIAFGGVRGESSPERARAVLARYPGGAGVTVVYNPEKPSEAVLERAAGEAKLALIGGIICLALAVCIACPLAIGVLRNWVPGLN